MGPEAAINAVFFNQIQAIEEPEASASGSSPRSASEYSEDIDILHLASELVVDAVIEPDPLRAELSARYALAESKDRALRQRRNPDHACLRAAGRTRDETRPATPLSVSRASAGTPRCSLRR